MRIICLPRCAKMYQCVQKLLLRFLTLFSWLYKLCQLTYVKRGLLRFVINTWPQEQLTFLILTIPPQPGHALHKGMLEILERDISPMEKRSESDTQSITIAIRSENKHKAPWILQEHVITHVSLITCADVH